MEMENSRCSYTCIRQTSLLKKLIKDKGHYVMIKRGPTTGYNICKCLCSQLGTPKYSIKPTLTNLKREIAQR